jgi:aryl-alcohol dehydrogenase-like predicted oxidoreductase
MRYLDMDTAKKVSKIGLGTWQFGSREWGYGDSYAGSEAKAIVRRALELGVTLFDTAEIYGFGRSERILGDALGDNLESVFLATKILPVMPIAPIVEQRAVSSASRLGARKLDLYQVHQPNPAVRDGTIMRGMRALQRTGLVDEVGVSNYSLRRWIAAEDALGSRVLSNQVKYSLADRRPERDLVPYAEAHGRVIIAYSPLAQGLLSGRYDAYNRPSNPVRANNALFLPENLERGRALGLAVADRAGLADPQPGCGGDPRRIDGRPARKQRRGRGHRSLRGGVPAAAIGVRAVLPGHRGRCARRPDQEPPRSLSTVSLRWGSLSTGGGVAA